jgi:penicillin-binding protein 1C
MKRCWSIVLLAAACLLAASSGWYFLARPLLLEGVPFSSTIRDRHGALLRLTTASDQRYRMRIGMHEVPEDLVEAVMKQEDRGYWQHIGVNPLSLLRANCLSEDRDPVLQLSLCKSPDFVIT